MRMHSERAEVLYMNEDPSSEPKFPNCWKGRKCIRFSLSIFRSWVIRGLDMKNRCDEDVLHERRKGALRAVTGE